MTNLSIIPKVPLCPFIFPQIVLFPLSPESCESVSLSIVSDSLQPLACSLPPPSVHGILQARILEWIDIPRPYPGWGLFPTQGLNPDLLHCRQILYCLSQETPSAPPDRTWKAFIRTCLESRSGALFLNSTIPILSLFLLWLCPLAY